MQTNNVKPVIDETPFPDYLGFGKLKKETIRQEENCRVADYTLLDTTVHTLKIGADQVIFSDVFDGKTGAESYSRTIKGAILQHFTCCKPSRQPAFLFFYSQVCRLGNVYFRHLDENDRSLKMVYYPAGHLFLIRLPVTKENTLKAHETSTSEYLKSRLYGYYETKLTLVKRDGPKDTIKITLMEFVVPMAFVHDFIKFLVENNIILPQKHFRVIVEDVSAAMSNALQIFYGTKKDEWSIYTLECRGLKDSLT